MSAHVLVVLASDSVCCFVLKHIARTSQTNCNIRGKQGCNMDFLRLLLQNDYFRSLVTLGHYCHGIKAGRSFS